MKKKNHELITKNRNKNITNSTQQTQKKAKTINNDKDN